MRKFGLSLCLLITGMLLMLTPFSASATELSFQNYLGKTIDEIIAVEGQPDEEQDKALIYRHKILDGREFTVRYHLGDKTVEGIDVIDNAPETAPVIKPAADWNWVSDMDKTVDEIMARWDRPQSYSFGKEYFMNSALDELSAMSYRSIELNGHMYQILYLFHKNKPLYIMGATSLHVSNDAKIQYADDIMTELIGVLDNPAWVYYITRLKMHYYMLVDEKYMVTIDNSLRELDSTGLEIFVESHDINYKPSFYMIPSSLGIMASQWEREDTRKGGDYAKLLRVKQEADAYTAKISKIRSAIDKWSPYPFNTF